MLSRLAADSGTPTSALVAWNSCGAFMAAVLGISTISYLPFAVFNSVAPVLSVIDGITGFKIVRTTRQKPRRRPRFDPFPAGHVPLTSCLSADVDDSGPTRHRTQTVAHHG